MKKTMLACALAVLLSQVLSACDSSEDGRVVGQLESDRIEITAEFAEPIMQHHVVEGEAVGAGQLLSQQNTDRVSARVDEAAAALQERRERLAELIRGPREERIVAGRANAEGAVRDLELRQIEYDRAIKLLDQNLASPAVRDRAKAALDAAKASLEFYQAQLEEMLSGTTIEELGQAEQAVRAAAANLASLQVDLDRHSTVTSVDGIVDSILFEPGERPVVGQPVMVLLAGKQPYARVYIPAAMRVSVTPGLEARVYVDGRTDVIDARVRWVSAEAAFTPYYALTEHDRGRLTYFAKIDLLGLDERLPDGVPVEVAFPGLRIAVTQ